ncbi:MAG: hypothetical protein D6739_02420, partial [Nitrospirae bacterium]
MRRLAAVALALLAAAACRPQPPKAAAPAPPPYRIFVHYELGMHCTGFDFSYCCILPPYNSVQAQVVRVGDPPVLCERADPADPTVLVDPVDGRRLRLRYTFEDNTFSEGSKLAYWSVPYDADGDGDSMEPGEVVANAYWTHLYLFDDLEGHNRLATSVDAKKRVLGRDVTVPRDAGPAGQRLSSRPGQPVYLRLSGPAGTRLWTKSPVLDNTPIVLSLPGIWEAVGLPLTPFLDSGQLGKPFVAIEETDVQPFQEVTVTLVDAESGAPILDAQGRPVASFGTEPIDVPNCARCHAVSDDDPRHLSPNRHREDGSPVTVVVGGRRRSLPELVAMERTYWLSVGASQWMTSLKAAAVSMLGLHDVRHGTSFLAHAAGNATGSGNRLGRDPVLCQKCHADNVVGALASAGVVAADREGRFLADLTDAAKVDRFAVVDYANRDGALAPGAGRAAVVGWLRPPRASAVFRDYLERLRRAAALPQRNDADLPGRAVAATTGPVAIPTLVVPPLTQALHDLHLRERPLPDAAGRTAACQACHPSHRYDRSLTGFPLEAPGVNPYAGGDNRDAAGGCYQGRDAHANPRRDADGAPTPSHLNAIGRWLRDHVAEDRRPDGSSRGLWCTNCHTEVSRRLYRLDHLHPGRAHAPSPGETVRTRPLPEIAKALGLTPEQLTAALDPKVGAPSPFGLPGS